MHLLKVLILIFAVVVVSCNHNTKEGSSLVNCENLEIISIDCDQESGISYDEVIDSVYFLKLETAENGMIGMVSSIFIADSSIIIVDRFIADAVFIFDMNGHFKRRVSYRGNGPHEYMKLGDVCLTYDKKNIVLCDEIKRQLLFFNLEGDWVKTTPIPYNTSGWGFLENQDLIANIWGCIYDNYPTGFSTHGFAVLDSSFKSKHLFSHNKGKRAENITFSKSRTIRQFGEKVFVSPNMNDTIYEVSSEGVKARYYIDIRPEGTLAQNFSTNKEYENTIRNYYFFGGDFLELEDYTVFYLKKFHTSPLVMYNHKTKEPTLCNQDFSFHPFLMLLTSPMEAYGTHTMVEAHTASTLMEFKNSLPDYILEEPDVTRLFDGLSIDDNPVIFFYRIKDT